MGVPRQTRRKLDRTAKLGIMLGYAQQTKSYHIWLKYNNKLVETINIRFNETKKGLEVISGPKVKIRYVYFF